MNIEIALKAEEKDLKCSFGKLKSPKDVAELLEIDFKVLNYHLYINPPPKRYTTFYISKRKGGKRKISVPIASLKILQSKLNTILNIVYEPKASVHGFMKNRGIVSNANMHTKRKYVLNLDLKEFFPSINFGRVRGMFMAVPYNLPPAVATVLAQICCHDNEIPQGAPTSPIISNMICAKLDSKLRKLAVKHACIYTRYADDITFSTYKPNFPTTLASIVSTDTGNELAVGRDLIKIIESNGFEVNHNKTRLQTSNHRQEVTGLITNKFVNVNRKYIRQVRAMLHAWRKYGEKKAEEEFFDKYDTKHRSSFKSRPLFKQIVKGKIEFLRMVRGHKDPLYVKYNNLLATLAPDIAKEIDTIPPIESPKNLIITEGKTDWKHLKNAYEYLVASGKYLDLNITFHEYENDMGDTELLKMCKTYSRTDRSKPVIFVFDRDNDKIMKEIISLGKEYKNWGKNVFSLVIPVPSHRTSSPSISIEFYYKNSEICQKAKNGRRLFLNNEFDKESGRHKDNNWNCTELNKIGKLSPLIIDNKVFNENNENIALSKNDFADYVLKKEKEYENFDVVEFEKIFDLIAKIVN